LSECLKEYVALLANEEVQVDTYAICWQVSRIVWLHIPLHYTHVYKTLLVKHQLYIAVIPGRDTSQSTSSDIIHSHTK